MIGSFCSLHTLMSDSISEMSCYSFVSKSVLFLKIANILLKTVHFCFQAFDTIHVSFPYLNYLNIPYMRHQPLRSDWIELEIIIGQPSNKAF